MTEPERHQKDNVVPLYPLDPAPSRGDQLAAGRADLYRFAAERSLATLKSQQDELAGTRTRSVQVMAFLGAATTFLVGTALNGLGREAAVRQDFLYQGALWVACLSAALAVLLLLSILTGRPGRLRPYETAQGTPFRVEWKLNFMFDLRGDTLADWVVDPKRGIARESGEFYELVTRQGRKMELYNRVRLASIQFRFRLFIVFIMVQLAGWMLLALRYG